MALTIDELEIQIISDAKKSTKGIDALATSLGNLKTALGGASGLATNLESIAGALRSLSSVGKINLTSTINQLTKLKNLIPVLGGAQVTQFTSNLRQIGDALSSLSSIPRSGLGSAINALKKIPEITASLNPGVITAFSNAMQQLTSAVTPFATQMSKISAGFKSFNTRIKTSTAEIDKSTKSAQNASRKYNSFSTSLAFTASKFLTLYYAARRIVDVFADAYNESNEYIESLNLFKVSMGDAAKVAGEFADKVSEIMGIDPADWMQNQGVFQRMATGFGISATQAEIMSTNLTQLAYDMASFFNTDVTTAMQKLQSGMSGQIKGLKAWGYNLSVAALQETALSLGIKQSVRTMTEAQKAQLRYITLIQKSNGVMGDMAKTLNTPANAMRILSAQMTQFKRAMGDIISVIVTKFIPYIQAFVELLKEAAKAIAALMGFKIEELPTNNLEMGAEVIDGIGDSIDGALDKFSELKKQLMGFDELNILKAPDEDSGAGAGALYDLGFEMPSYDFLKGADSKYKEIIEEIKAAVVGLKDVFDSLDFSPITKRVGEMFKTIKGQFKGLDFKTPLTQALKNVLVAATEYVNLIVQVVAPIWEALNIPKVTLDSINLSVEVLGALGDIVRSLTPLLKGLADGVAPVFEWLNGAVSKLLVFLTNLFSKVGDWFEKMEPKFSSLGKSLGGIVEKLWAFLEPLASTVWDGFLSVLGGVADVILLLADCIVSLLDTILGDEGLNSGFGELFEILTPLRDFVGSALSNVFSWLSSVLGYLATDVIPVLKDTLTNLWHNVLVPLGEFIGAVLAPVFQIISDVLGYLWEEIVTPLAEKLGGSLKNAFEDLSEILNTVIIPVLNAVIKVFTFLWNKVLTPIVNFLWDVLGPVVKQIFEGIGTAVGGLLITFDGLIKFIKGVFTADWETAWDGVKKIFVGIFETLAGPLKIALNGAIALFEGLANKIVDGFNWIKKQINSLDVNIPDWLGGGEIGFNLKMSDHISIPRFADGGFPGMGQMFIARERGPELVGSIGNKAAVANNDQIIQGIASGVYSAMMAAQEDSRDSGGTNARIVVQIGERAVGEAAVRFINGQIVQTGANPIRA